MHAFCVLAKLAVVDGVADAGDMGCGGRGASTGLIAYQQVTSEPVKENVKPAHPGVMSQ